MESPVAQRIHGMSEGVMLGMARTLQPEFGHARFERGRFEAQAVSRTAAAAYTCGSAVSRRGGGTAGVTLAFMRRQA